MEARSDTPRSGGKADMGIISRRRATRAGSIALERHFAAQQFGGLHQG